MNIYFGDLHNHCNISYGFGNQGNALRAAREHLDFCTVTGHALWPDMYDSDINTAYTVEYHKTGFKKLEDDWDNVREKTAGANKNGSFVTFQSYEMHSSEFGDHHILSPDDSLELYKADTPGEIIRNLRQKAIAIPHHVAYSPGYRGISWKDFDGSISPVVEVYSKHGCGVSEESADQYLHTMGPRDGRNTVYEGLRQGKKFGFTGSTDHHAGYPGSYGDGITAVPAEDLSREAIWNAILKRRTYALTGDRIRCGFTVNGEPMGSEISANGNCKIKFEAIAVDFVDKAVIYKNLIPVKAVHREDIHCSEIKSGKYKIRIETGWGRRTCAFEWNNRAMIQNGRILSVDKCFRGQSVLAPKEGVGHSEDVNKLPNKVIAFSEHEIKWQCVTFKNPTTRHSATCAVVLEIEGSPDTMLNIEINGKSVGIRIGELLKSGISGHLQPYASEAYLIHKAVPESMYNIDINHTETAKSGDFFHAELHQANGQSAWISPVFIK